LFTFIHGFFDLRYSVGKKEKHLEKFLVLGSRFSEIYLLENSLKFCLQTGNKPKSKDTIDPRSTFLKLGKEARNQFRVGQVIITEDSGEED
jgi:hypothetical protein